MKEIESIYIFSQYLRAKPIMIVMEMVTAKPVNVNAWLIMSMQKIAPIMDVSTIRLGLCHRSKYIFGGIWVVFSWNL